MNCNTSRRYFLQATAALSACGHATLRLHAPLATTLAGMAALAQQTSHAADTGGPYKALVCLFMNGGSDSHNWVVPTDATGYRIAP